MKEKATTIIESANKAALIEQPPESLGDNVRNLTPEEQEIKIKELNTLLEEKKEHTELLKEKVYLVEGGKKIALGILFFLENYAQWQYTESMGIVEVNKIIKHASEELVDKKDKFFLKSLELEALFYYLRKSGGTGLKEATEFIDEVSPIINPVIAALNKSASEKKRVEDEINQAHLDLASAEEGIEILPDPIPVPVEKGDTATKDEAKDESDNGKV